MSTNPLIGKPFLKPRGFELWSIVEDNRLWDAEPRDSIFPNSSFYIIGGDVLQCLGFYPFGEVVYCHQDELPLTRGSRKWAEYVHAPFCKLKWTENRLSKIGRPLMNIRKDLAFSALLHQFLGIMPN